MFVPTTLCHTCYCCCCFITFASARPRIPPALPALKPASPPIFLRLHRDPWGLIFRVSPQTTVALFPSQLGNTTPSSLEHSSSKQQHRRSLFSPVLCSTQSVLRVPVSTLKGNTYLRQATGSIAALLRLFIYARKPIYFPPLAGFSCSGTSCEHQHSINIIRFSATGRSNSQLLENE